MEQTPVRIAGRFVTTDVGMDVRNPFTGGTVATVPACGPEHVDAACEAAAAALARGLPQHARARVLETAAEELRGRTDEFGQRIAVESGKPVRTARAEVERCIDTLTLSAVEARTLAGEVVPMEATRSGADRLGFTVRVPIGVVAAITPFNFPLNLVAHKLGPAIAAGCPVVLKPAERTPLSAIALVELLVRCGLPADWISVVTGDGATVGQALVTHPIPRLVSFTGSAAVGWRMPELAPRKRIALELGSAAPLIVEPDADLADVAARVAVAGFAHAGQSCISTQRVLVHRSVEHDLLVALKEAVGALRVGDPLDERTDVGPLISQAEAERVAGWIEDAVGGGGALICGGRVEGAVLQPTIVAAPPADCALLTEEVFGPVIVVCGYDDLDEAFALAGAPDLAIHAGIFTRDIGVALRAIRELDYAGVIVNDVPTYRADQQPYGGIRASGNTREGPAYAVREMTDVRFVAIAG